MPCGSALLEEDIMSNSKWINGGFFNHGKYNDRTQRR